MLCLGWRQSSAGTGVRPCTHSGNVEGEPGSVTGMELEPVYPNKTLVSVSASRWYILEDKEKSHEPELSSPCNNHGMNRGVTRHISLQ